MHSRAAKDTGVKKRIRDKLIISDIVSKFSTRVALNTPLS